MVNLKHYTPKLHVHTHFPFEVYVLSTTFVMEHCFLLLSHVRGGDKREREGGALNVFNVVS